MKVIVEYLGHIKKIIGSERAEEVKIQDEASVANLLKMLYAKYGEPFKKAVYEPSGKDVKVNYIITVNGYLLNQLKGLDTKLKHGDHVAILPIVSGG